jgi:hypothetical protein
MGVAELKEMAKERGTVEIDGIEAFREAVGALLTLASANVDILTRRLDFRIFDHEHVVTEMKRISLGSRRAQVRVLIHDASALTHREHRLWALMRRLPTYFELRIPSADYRKLPANFVIADRVGSVYQPNSELYEGLAQFYDPTRAGQLRRQFGEIWESAEQSPELRTMRI